jgi:TRAP-type C4-dicarboxylate transport system permease small subunit
MCSILLVILVFLPLAYVEWNKKQLTVSVLFDLMPKQVQYWLWKLQHLVILVVTSYLTVAAWDVMQRNMDTGNKTAALGIPMYMLYLILFVGLGLTALTKVIQLFMLKEEAELHAD